MGVDHAAWAACGSVSNPELVDCCVAKLTVPLGVSSSESSACSAVHTLKRLPIGTAYDAWTGIGSVGVVVGMALFDNPVTAVRIGCIVLIVASVFGRHLAGSGSTCAARGPLCGKGLTVWPGIAVQYGHKQLVMPLTIPAQRLAQPALMAEAALLIDPLGPRVEVIDTEAYPVQANGAQREVDDEPGDLGSVTPTEQVRPGEPDTIVGRFVARDKLVEDCLAQERAVRCPDGGPIRSVVVLLSGGEPSFDRGSVEPHMGAGQTVDLWIRQRRKIVLQDDRE